MSHNDEQAALLAWMETVSKVLGEVSEERLRQQIKWGEQNHPNGTGDDLSMSRGQHLGWADEHREDAIARCERAFAGGRGTYEHILTEEYAEALAEDDPARLRVELIQVAAVAVAWVEKIDRDLSTRPGMRPGGDA